jgi:NAD(P)-dependent dehydrogenase (short-subunit alcohol dehydrogenase family)
MSDDANDRTQPSAAEQMLGDFAEADDIAKVALFLASDATGYMTGSTVVVDRGQLIA